VRRGLSSEPKHLFPRYLYDELGSQLFDAICLLPEYYLTRAENEILTRYAGEIVGSIETANTLIEMGVAAPQKLASLSKRYSRISQSCFLCRSIFRRRRWKGAPEFYCSHTPVYELKLMPPNTLTALQSWQKGSGDARLRSSGIKHQ